MTADFVTLGVREDISSVLRNSGITEPTAVQEQVIPHLLKGDDVIVQSQTGTGKTLAFLLPILEGLNVDLPYIQALIITPTRELAIQITKEVQKLAPIVGANMLAVYGGQDVERQIKKLKGSPHIVVGTPGRLADHILRKTVDFTRTSMLVLDEADVMLSMGFLKEVEFIIKTLPGRRQSMLFSATIPRGLKTLAAHYMKKPHQIRIQSRHVTLDEIQELTVETTEEKKIDTLCSLIDQVNPYLAIVFCKTKTRASEVNEALITRGYSSDELHGDLSQSKRNQVMRKFRDAKLQILVATDIAARGLDIEGVSHIFNYDIPQDVESYIHRIGRTGRAGQTGAAYTFVTSRDHDALKMIESGINRRIKDINEDDEKDKPKRRRENEREGRESSDRGNIRLSSFKRGSFEKSQSSRRYPSARSGKSSPKGRKK